MSNKVLNNKYLLKNILKYRIKCLECNKNYINLNRFFYLYKNKCIFCSFKIIFLYYLYLIKYFILFILYLFCSSLLVFIYLYLINFGVIYFKIKV